jgi:hypothetical protein
MLVLGQVCVLLTGMGLVNLQGRIAFFQALNQYCATVFELLFYETEAGKAPVHIKTLHQPTYGRKMSKPDNHRFLLLRVNCWQDEEDEDAINKAATAFRSVLKSLTMLPCMKRDFSNEDLKAFYRRMNEVGEH